MTKAKKKKKINPVLLDFTLIAGCALPGHQDHKAGLISFL